MKKPLNFGSFRSKRIDILIKETPQATYNESNGQAIRSLLRSSMKTINASNTIKTLNSQPVLTPPHFKARTHSLTSASRTRGSSGYKNVRSQSNKPQSAVNGTETCRLMSPTSSSLKKLIKLHGPNKTYLKEIQDGPGPGAYFKELEIGGVSWRIGQAKRVRDRKQVSVGPGAYDAPQLPAGKRYSMTARRKQENKIFDFPGPGTYLSSTLDPGIKFSISKAEISKNRKIDSPGPGAYSLPSPSSSRSARYALNRTGKSIRPPLSQILDTPGPGSYHFDLKIGGPELSMRIKSDFQSKSIEPGPGSYTPRLFSQTAPAWKFGSSKKRLQLNDFSVPEPGWYNSQGINQYK